jgi:hypothetical protein
MPTCGLVVLAHSSIGAFQLHVSHMVLPWSLLYTDGRTETEIQASNRCLLCSADTYVVTGCFCADELNAITMALPSIRHTTYVAD